MPKTIALSLALLALPAHAGPETALREFAGGQVKKGVRTIGMGGDGATTGNYALVYKDAGGAIFDHLHPTLGVEQALVAKRVWARVGLDETTWTTGMSLAVRPFKIDLAYLFNLAAARTADVFGKRNASLIATIGFDYESLLGSRM